MDFSSRKKCLKEKLLRDKTYTKYIGYDLRRKLLEYRISSKERSGYFFVVDQNKLLLSDLYCFALSLLLNAHPRKKNLFTFQTLVMVRKDPILLKIHKVLHDISKTRFDFILFRYFE